MLVSDLLRQKGTHVITAPATATCREALAKLVENRIGAVLLVDDDGLPQGIITERDFLRLTYESSHALESLPVSEVMTRNLLVGLPTDDLEYLMGVMTKNRLRHVPIVSGRELAGIISIGDVVKAMLRETQITNRYLSDYISGKYTG